MNGIKPGIGNLNWSPGSGSVTGSDFGLGTEPGLGTRHGAGTLNGIWNRNPEPKLQNRNSDFSSRFRFTVPFLVLLWNRNLEQNQEWNRESKT